MPAKKVNTVQDVIWGNKSVEANARLLPPSRGPASTDPEWNELVDTVQDPTLGHAHTGAAQDGKKIVPSTINAADNPHDIGSPEHSFNTGFSMAGGAIAGSSQISPGSAGLQQLGQLLGPYNVSEEIANTGAIDKIALGPGLWTYYGDGSVFDFSENAQVPIRDLLLTAPLLTTFVGGFIGYDSVLDRVVYTNNQFVGQTEVPLFDKLDQIQNKVYGWHEADAAISAFGITAPTRILEGTGATAVNLSSTNTYMTTYTTGNASGNRAGVQSGSFAETNWNFKPSFSIRFRISQTTNMRLWLGLTSANIGSIDTLGTIRFAGLRYSTGAGDSKFTVVTSNGVSMFTNALLNITVSSGQEYLFTLFRGPNGTIFALTGGGSSTGYLLNSTAVPNAALGFQFTMETLTAASQSWSVSGARFLNT